jgi:pimeloyl-ACP methyl ester carboxylesterase
MPFVKVGTENSADIEIHYRDHGSGRPIVLVHGYPLDGNSWERQERVLLEAGYRCISYDRRGFGYNTDVLAPDRIGDAAVRAGFQVASAAGPYASYVCVDSWLTDFRGDLPKIDVPTLVIHGTADRILPFASTAARLRDEQLIADLKVVEVPDGPHNIGWTFPEVVNPALLDFLGSA